MATTNATAPKGATKKQSAGFTGIKSGLSVIIACGIIAVCIYLFGFGHMSNFKGAENASAAFSFLADGEYEPNGLVGTVYKGGFVVPIIWTLCLTVVALAIERFFAIRNAYGRTSLTKFVTEIKAALAANDLVKAQQLCDKQRGSVANVVSSTLKKYKEMEENTQLTKEQKIIAIQKELEEATALEMPRMQENLPIIGTLVTLSTGISEALVNTASGIATGALAVIAYNYYTNKIDRLTFSLDEVGFTIVETFSATH